MNTPHLTVRGEAHIETDPDLAHIGITLTARGTDPRTTLNDLTQRNTAAINLIRGYGPALHNLHTTNLTLTPQLTRHGRDEHIHTHHATTHLTATLNDFTALNQLITHLTDIPLTTVDGPWWTLHPTSPIHTQARQQAVTNAIRRARDYAHALGTELHTLVELDATTPDHTPYPGPTHRLAYTTETAETTPPPLDLQPQRQTVTATVTARFTLHPPTL